MANEIRLKRGSGSDPGASDLVLGEPAVRTDTGEIFLKKDDGSIAKVAGGIDDGDKGDITVSNSGGTFTIDSGVITNAKVSGSAAIAGSKISPDFGSQAIATTSSLSCFAANITGDNQDSLNFTGSSTNANRGIAFNSKTALSHSNDTVLRINNNSEFNTVSITGAITATGDLTITSTVPRIFLTDSNNDSDFAIANSNGVFKINDETNSLNRLSIASDGTTTIAQNLDVGAGIDVTGVITATSHIDLPDDAKVKLGTGDDLEIYHSSNVNFIDSSTEVRIRGTFVALQPNGGGAQMALGTAGGSFALFHNGNQKLETVNDGINVTGKVQDDGASHDGDVNFTGVNSYNAQWDKSDASLKLLDNAKIKIGSGDDLQLYHDGSDSNIKNTTGHLVIQSDSILLKNSGSTESFIRMANNGAVELYEDNTKRLETSDYGSITTGVHSVSNGILELKSAIATSHTLTADYNAIAVDPTINNGVTVTVPSGAVWAIV